MKFFKRLLSCALIGCMLLAFFSQSTIYAAYENGYVGGQKGDGVGIYAYGLDISTWQGGEVDFQKIKVQGYSFVILRAGFSVYIDKQFERNYAEAKKAGLHVGVYLYSYADTVDEVLLEAEALKGWLKGKTLEYPVYYDMEEPETHGKMSPEALTELSLAFLDSMAADGWLVGLYSSKSWLTEKLQTDVICEKYECWMALYLWSGSYDTYDRYDEYCGMWQYSSTGTVEGVPGNVDMNVAFKDYPSICMQYGFNGYVASGESLSLSGDMAVPRVIASGESIPVSGRIVSNDGNLTNVTAAIYNTDGEQCTGRSAGPRTESFDLSELANGVKTHELAPGRYFYRVTATNSKYTRILKQNEFVISPAGVMGNGLTAPESLAEGDAFVPEGEVFASTNLKDVRIRITNGNGEEILCVSANPKMNYYTLNNLAELLNIQDLRLGEYHYIVTATTQLGTETLLDEVFCVWVADDPITIDGFVLKSEYRLNELVSFSGTLTSQTSEFREVCLSIYLEHQDEPILSVQAYGSTQISLYDLSKSLDLQTLNYGSYVCRIDAANDAGPVNVVTRAFVIRPDGLSLCDLNAPIAICQGDTYLISGAIASDYSPVKSISIAVLDEYGQIAFDHAEIVNVMVYDLSLIAPKLRFSDLETGEYTLRIRAENETTTQILYDARFRVTTSDDVISWQGAHCSANGISYTSYETMQFYGTLVSHNSQITSVKAEVYAHGEFLMGAAELQTSATTVDIRIFNEMLRLSALPAGSYRLVLSALNASGSFVMLDEVFNLSDCAHSDVRSGVIQEQRCDRIGAICDSRCASCGERTQTGNIISSDEHEWNGAWCRYCGTAKMNIYTLRRAKNYRHMGRYMIAYCHDDRWFALDRLGATVPIGAPNVNGEIDASSELLWTMHIKHNYFFFANSFGRLHLEHGRLGVAGGVVNTRLRGGASNEGLQFTLLSEERSLMFCDDAISVGETPDYFVLFELQPESE